jgi:hypothetical protein
MVKPLAKLLDSRLSAGVMLALLAACGEGRHAGRPVIGVVQVSSIAPLDEAREGFYKALADSSLIMREFVQQGATQVGA